jgi:GntR family transcriptional regulator/MocR family aminotransferase
MVWKPTLGNETATPLHVQIRRQIRDAVRSGDLRPGEKLSGVRDLADDLGVNRLTVLKAIRALTSTGLLTSVRGKGVFVVDQPEGLEPRPVGPPNLDGPFFEGVAEGPADPATGAAISNVIQSTVEDAISGRHLAFSAGFPPRELIPTDLIRTRISRLLREPHGADRLGYVSTEGDGELRAELRALLEQRGLVLGSDDHILITAGAQQGLSLCLRTMVRPGEAVALESPTYMGAIAACRMMEVPMAPVPVDRAGLNPERLESALRRREIAGIYTVPSFQNPTGVTQTLRRRSQILELARRHDALVIEDDTYADLRLGGRGVPPLKSLPGGERVVYLGSFSKSLAPGLRVGFLVATSPFSERLRQLKEITDINTGGLAQGLVADLLRSGLYRRHLARVRREYRKRRDAMIEALAEHLPPTARFTRPRGGLHVWVMLAQPIDAVRLNERARREEGVSFAPGALFFCDGRRSSSFRLNYSSHPADRIEGAVRRLARSIVREDTT